MKVIGQVESVWRYPVKSMRGQRLEEAFAGFAGIYGDRLYAFHSAGAPAGFPFLTGREQEELLLYRPAFRRPDAMRLPPNLAEAEALAVTSVYPPPADTSIDVETPDGEKLSLDAPDLIRRIADGLQSRHALTLMRSDRAMTDCRPISLFGIWTARQLADEIGMEIDRRRFRANLYVDFASRTGFAEDGLVGRSLRIGGKAAVSILERDARCKMITLDPDTSRASPEIMRSLARNHDGKAGVYAAVLVEGVIRPGDEVTLLD